MTILILLAALLWLLVSLMVVALCVTAARGDAQQADEESDAAADCPETRRVERPPASNPG